LPFASNGLHLRRHPVRRSRIGAAVAIQVFLQSVATDVTKDAVPEGPSDERSEERSADAVLHVWRRAPITAKPLKGLKYSARHKQWFFAFWFSFVCRRILLNLFLKNFVKIPL
jgi:hypothetical protein